jgi:hypothetical protein
MNPLNRNHREAFSKASNFWYRHFSAFRSNKRDQVCSFAGHRYAQDSGLGTGSEKVLVNLIQLLVVSLTVALAYNRPRFKLTTSNAANRNFARFYQESLNAYVARLKLERESRKIILDAIFWMGIGMRYGDRPFQHVSTDNFVYDAGEEDYDRGSFYMHRYRVPLEDAKNDPRFDPKEAAKLEPTKKSDRQNRSESTESLTGPDSDDGELEPMVDLTDVWFRREQRCCTWPINGSFEILTDRKPLYADDCGKNPFDRLTYMDVPGNALPVSLIDAVYDNFLIFNGLLRKMAVRAKKLREIPIYKPGGEDDLRRAMMAGDLEAVKVNDKDSIGLLKLFGLDQNLNAFTFSMLEMFKQGTSLDELAGLAPTAETVGQSEQISTRVDQRLAMYRSRTNEFMADVGSGLAEHMFTDPDLVVARQQAIPNTSFKLTVDATWYPPHIMERPGLLEEYDVAIEPYSMEFQHPMAQLQKINQQVQVINPIMQAQGIPFNAEAYLDLAADLTDQPILRELWNFGGLPQEQMMEEGQRAQDNSPHVYERRNVSMGANGNGRLQQLMQQQASSGAESGSMVA